MGKTRGRGGKVMILAVIPARGGSKGIPGKNIKDLYGQPLISYTIQAALDCKKIDRVVVSTGRIRQKEMLPWPVSVVCYTLP